MFKRLLIIAPWAITCAALGFLLCMFLRFSVDVPYLDQWEFVPFLEKMTAGSLGWPDFWAQHNEHRIVFPRMIMAGLAWATHWNIYYELVVNAVLGFVFFLLMARQARRTLGNAPGRPAWWLPLTALLLFSLSQWQNWFLGWQLQLFLSAVTACGALLLLSSPAPSRWSLWGAVGLGFIATFSFANGLLVWGVGLALILCRMRTRRDISRIALSGWLAAGTVAIALYVYGYQAPPYHGPPGLTLLHPWRFFEYVLVYLGQPIINWNVRLAGSAGAFGLILWSTLMIRLWRDPETECITVLPYLGLSLYAVGSAALTAFARSGAEGSAQALSSRYITLANPLWFCIVVLACIALREDKVQDARPRVSATAWIAGAIFTALVLCASGYGAYRWTERYAVYTAARTELVTGQDQGHLGYLYPDAEKLMQRRGLLERLNLSVFRNR